MIRTITCILAVTALLSLDKARAEPTETTDAPEPHFEVAGGNTADFLSDGGFEIADADFAGNPLKRLVNKWPEDLVVAPIPGRSPQLGWKLTLASGYFLNPREEESETAPSILGGFVMVAENGSYAYGGGANLHLLDDKLRVQLGAGFADIRYRFYGIGNEENSLGIETDILQEAPLYFGRATWRVWNKLYVGLGYMAGSVDTRLRFELPESNFFDPSLKLDIGAFAVPLQFDSRDHEQFPRTGWLIDGRTMLYRESAGGDFDAEIFKVSVNHYYPVREKDTIAFRLVARSTSGDAPFFLLSTFGGSTDLRGYPSGRYRDRMMYAVQSEYRWQYSDSWIFTGFAGVGEVAEDFSKFGHNFLPAAGIGTRYVVSQKHRVSLSADVAVGDDGVEFYFGVGEAF